MRSMVYLRILFCVPALCQPVAQSFEATSVKPASPAAARAWPTIRGGPGTSDPARITFTNVTLISVLLRAYNVMPYQASGPAWLSSERYDITATIPAGTTKEQTARMLQNLLAERFGLALHHETRDLQGFELTVGKGGSKLKVSSGGQTGASEEPDSPPKTDSNGFPVLNAPGLEMMEGVRGKTVVSFLNAKAQPISALTDRLSREFRQPILDKTGLSGNFDFTLEFAPQPPGAAGPAPSMEGPPDTSDESGPNLLTAVQQQLGLKLNRAWIAVDVLIVDRANRLPIGN